MKYVSFSLNAAAALLIAVPALVIARMSPALYATVPLVTAKNIAVGPNIQVDQDPTVVFSEPMIASSPTDARTLIGTSMYFSVGDLSAKIYRSNDGGYSWIVETPPQDTNWGGDVQVAFDAAGTAYFADLGHQSGPVSERNTRNGMYVFRSSPDGHGWRRLVFVQYRSADGKLSSYDHEQLAIDTGVNSRFRGRIYLSTLYTIRDKPQENRVGVLYSSDAGRTFHGPNQITNTWVFNSPLAILSDGTLLAPYIGPFSKKLGAGAPVGVAISTDGGKSFARHRNFAQMYRETPDFFARMRRGETDFDGDGVPRYAVDRSDRFKDRIYVAWSDVRFYHSRVLFSYSADRGASWSTPRMIAADAPVRASQYQPEIAVSPSGTLGVSWFDTRDGSGNTYNEYFSASLDGGKTFLRPARVSSAPSLPRGPGNTSFSVVGAYQYEGQLWTPFITSVGRYPSGGDYMGLTVDGNGVFHPFWIDGRSGTNQVWTASVEILDATEVQPATVAQDMTSTVTLTYDQPTWDAKSRVTHLPVRLRNTTDHDIYGPFTITVTRTGFAGFSDAKHPDRVTVLNSDNHKTGVGATLIYDSVMGGLKHLPPGGISEARVWDLQINNVFSIEQNLGVHITGYVKSVP